METTDNNPTDNNPIEIKIEDKANIMLDMSSWDLFEMCEARYNYRHNLLRATRGKATALDLGSAVHEGMDGYYKALAEGLKYEERLQAALVRSRTYMTSEQSDLEPDDISLVSRTIEENTDYWRHEDEFFRIIDVERAFAYNLYEDDHIRIIITGKIDLLVDILDYSGKLKYESLPIDHKTFSRSHELSRLSNQFQNYTYAVGSNYLIVNRIGFQKTLKPEEKFKRVPLSYDPLILDSWKRNLISGITNKYLNCVATGEWRMNFTSCFSFNRKCEYHDICDTSGEENRIHKLNNYISASPWDVTHSFTKNK